MNTKILSLLKNKYTQLVLALVAGAAIGVLFYPSKTEEYREKIQFMEKKSLEIIKQLEEKSSKLSTLQEEYNEQTSSIKSLEKETKVTINSLTTENKQLRQSAKRKYFKLVKPDGTIIEKEYEESNSEEITSVVTEIRQEFDTKVKSIESKWKSAFTKRLTSVKEDYEKKLKEKKTEIVVVERIVEKERIVKVNEKKLRTEIGISSEKKLYLHTTYPLFGPVLLGGGASAGKGGSSPEARIGFGLEW